MTLRSADGPPSDPSPWTLRGLFLASGVWVAAIAPFGAVILRERGLDPFAIGIVSALGALAATLIVPAWGHLADVRVGRAPAFRIAVLVASGAALALALPLPVALIAAVVASFSVLIGAFLALGDALAMAGLPSPERQYGSLRALASLSFAIGVIGAGFLYDHAGYAAAPFVSLAAAGAVWLLLGELHDVSRDRAWRAEAARQVGHMAAPRFGSVGRAFAVQPRLLGILAALALAFTGLQGAFTFVAIRIVELGGHPSDVALSFGISAFMEIPGLVVAAWLARRFGLRWLFLIAIVPFALAVASWGVLPTALAINATRLVTGLGFGTLSAARVLIIPRLLPPSLQATGQALTQAATVGLGTVIGNLLGGLIYGSLGPTAYFATSGALAIAGGIGVWWVLRGAVGDREAVTAVR